MHAELAIVSLFAVASVVALVAKRLRLPYTVALVVAGLTLGTIDVVEAPHLTKELLYTVFLPGLLFEAAFHVKWQKFWENKLTIHSLAVPGVVLSILVTALVFTPVASGLELEANFRFVDGLVFAAILASTDPIAVVALFKTLGAPKRLAVLIEGESLFNDGTSIVLLGMILGLALGGQLSVPTAVLEFVRVVGLGALVGGGLGYAVSKVIQRVEDPMVEITLTTIAAWGSFIVAEQVHASGVIATVAAGMLCGNYAARTGMSPSTIVAVGTFWEYVAFALNSLVFLLIGFEVHVDQLVASWLPIVVAWTSVTAARAIVVFGVAGLLRRTTERIPWSWAAVLSWGGMRGGLSMVLALSLAADVPHREFLVTVTFGAVVISILMQGLTMAPALRRLGIIGERVDRIEREASRAALAAATSARVELETFAGSHGVPAVVVAELRAEYARRVDEATQRLTSSEIGDEALLDEERKRARRHLLMVERTRVAGLVRDGLLTEEAAHGLLADVDARLQSLDDPTPQLEHEPPPQDTAQAPVAQPPAAPGPPSEPPFP